MSSSWGQQPSPYVAGETKDARLSAGRVLARTLLVVIPGQLLGFVIASFAIPFDAMVAHPALGWLLFVVAAVVAGVGLGLILRPTRRELAVYAIVSALVGAVVLFLFLAVAHTSMTAGNARSLLSDVVRGVPLTALLQTALAVLLWRGRLTRSS